MQKPALDVMTCIMLIGQFFSDTVARSHRNDIRECSLCSSQMRARLVGLHDADSLHASGLDTTRLTQDLVDRRTPKNIVPPTQSSDKLHSKLIISVSNPQPVSVGAIIKLLSFSARQ
jgi:hypothetical protein